MNENLEEKKQKYENLKNEIARKYNEKITNINKIIKAIEDNSCINEKDNINTIVFKKYLELENVHKVANYINELGYRVKTQSYIGERKYIGNDITNILLSDVKVEKQLKEVVQTLQDKNYKASIKTWG